MCSRRGKDPASGHPEAPKPLLGRGPSPPGWDGRLDAPSSVWTRHRAVKQGKSGGSVGMATKGKEREVERERLGMEEEEGHKAVRGRWAPPPLEGKAKGKEREIERQR